MSAENLDALAALIRRERDALLGEWRHEVRQLSVAHNLDVPTLNNHIPYLLEELACELEACSDGSMIERLKEFRRAGLGLSIVRQLVEPHGGTVRVDSEGEGLGATFTVILLLMGARRRHRERAEASWGMMRSRKRVRSEGRSAEGVIEALVVEANA